MIRGQICSLCKTVRPLNKLSNLQNSPLNFVLPRLPSERGLYSPNDAIEKQGSYEGPGKTTISILNQDLVGMNLIDSYSSAGFRLNDTSFLCGPSIIFPTAVLRWNINSADEITEESLSLFTLLDPKLDLIVIGHGMDSSLVRNPVNPRVILAMKKKGYTLEVLATEKAISTYNYLLEEGRVVAATLIPPAYVKEMSDNSRVDKKRAQDTLYKIDANPFGMSRTERRKLIGKELKERRNLDRLIDKE